MSSNPSFNGAQAELSNFRDFGDLRLAGSARMLRGSLFRSEHTHGLSAAATERLRSLGIATIIDLRGVAERQQHLPVAAPGIQVISTPIQPLVGPRLAALREQNGLTRAAVHAAMVASYRDYVSASDQEFGKTFAAIVAAGQRPLLVHCTAGKDRTGFVVAVVQTALGVAWADVLAHYLVTNERLDRTRLNGHVDAHGEAMEPVLVAHAEYLEAAFAEIRERHGSVESFVTHATRGAVGLTDLQQFKALAAADASGA